MLAAGLLSDAQDVRLWQLQATAAARGFGTASRWLAPVLTLHCRARCRTCGRGSHMGVKDEEWRMHETAAALTGARLKGAAQPCLSHLFCAGCRTCGRG